MHIYPYVHFLPFVPHSQPVESMAIELCVLFLYTICNASEVPITAERFFSHEQDKVYENITD